MLVDGTGARGPASGYHLDTVGMDACWVLSTAEAGDRAWARWREPGKPTNMQSYPVGANCDRSVCDQGQAVSISELATLLPGFLAVGLAIDHLLDQNAGLRRTPEKSSP